MLTLTQCADLAAPYVEVLGEIWENDEAYYFDDLFGEWEDNGGVVVFKETGERMLLYEYFTDKKCWGIMRNFQLYGLPLGSALPKGWDEE